MTIIATPGAANANSYATLIEADAYHDTRLHNSAWTAATDAVKEAAMIWATRELDGNFCWDGDQKTETQALAWPRYGMTYKSGYYVDGSVVPQQVKDAESELAFLLIKKDRTVARCSGITKAKLTSMAIEKKDSTAGILDRSVVILIQEFGNTCGAGTGSGARVVELCRV